MAETKSCLEESFVVRVVAVDVSAVVPDGEGGYVLRAEASDRAELLFASGVTVVIGGRVDLGQTLLGILDANRKTLVVRRNFFDEELLLDDRFSCPVDSGGKV